MKKLIVTFFLFAISVPAFAYTRTELSQQLGGLEIRAGVMSTQLIQAAAGTTPLPKSKEDMLAELATIQGEAQRIQGEIAALPVVPTISTLTPQEALPGSEVVVQGTGFKAGAGNYISIKFGSAETDVIKVLSPTIVDATTLKFSIPTTHSFFGTYPVTVFIDGAGESNAKDLQILRPRATGDEPIRTGIGGAIDSVVNAVENAVGNFVNSDPAPVADPSTVLPSVSLVSAEPATLIPGTTLIVQGRGFSLTTSHLASLTNVSTGETVQLATQVTQTFDGVALSVAIPATFVAGDYTLQMINPHYETTNSKSFRVVAPCVPLSEQTRTRTDCPTGKTGVITDKRTSSCPSPTESPVWSNWNEISSTCTAPAQPATQTGGAQTGATGGSQTGGTQTGATGAGGQTGQTLSPQVTGNTSLDVVFSGVANPNGTSGAQQGALSGVHGLTPGNQTVPLTGAGGVTGVVVSAGTTAGGVSLTQTGATGATGQTGATGAVGQTGAQNAGGTAGAGTQTPPAGTQTLPAGTQSLPAQTAPAVTAPPPGAGVTTGPLPPAGTQLPVPISSVNNGALTVPLPLVSSAPDALSIPGILGRLQSILSALIPFIIGLAVFIIIWGIFRYITEAANEEKRAEARQFIVWGTIGVFMMISIWGFVTVLVNTFAVDKAIQEKDIPMVPKIESKLQLYNDPYLK